MSYKMFIDDERYPVEDDFIIVRNKNEFLSFLKRLGAPSYISFDHDLASNEYNGYDLAKILVEIDMNENGNFLPCNFSFYVHSANPVGKKNIEMFLNNYLEFKKNG